MEKTPLRVIVMGLSTIPLPCHHRSRLCSPQTKSQHSGSIFQLLWVLASQPIEFKMFPHEFCWCYILVDILSVYVNIALFIILSYANTALNTDHIIGVLHSGQTPNWSDNIAFSWAWLSGMTIGISHHEPVGMLSWGPEWICSHPAVSIHKSFSVHSPVNVSS